MKEVIKMSNNIKAPCRYDFVGSFLRPDYLKKARADFENGAITAEQLKEVEDKAILDLVAKQKNISQARYQLATTHLLSILNLLRLSRTRTQSQSRLSLHLHSFLSR